MRIYRPVTFHLLNKDDHFLTVDEKWYNPISRMRKKLLRAQSALLLTLALLLSSLPAAQAAFLDDGWGARPVGMGGAFTAISDDSNASLYNPAGIAQLQWNEFSATYAQLFSGLTLYSGEDQSHLDQSYLAFVAKPIPHI